MSRTGYVGRFAPSPTGPLHAGSLATALGAWLDAHAHDGRWLLRIEDLDPPREQPGAADRIIATLERFALFADEPVMRQSARHAHYEAALGRLIRSGLAYPCSCTRREIADSQLQADAAATRAATRAGEGDLVYPGTCRNGLAPGRSPRAWRLKLPRELTRFVDRRLGPLEQDVSQEVGDFVLKRADGLWAYQLAVVVDDAAQGITDVVRGCDLLGSTARQIVLQQALGLPTPRYLHLPVVTTASGEKLSKQTGARPVDEAPIASALDSALSHLGLAPTGASVGERLLSAVSAWRDRFGPTGSTAG